DQDRLDHHAVVARAVEDVVGPAPVVAALARLDQEPGDLDANVGDVKLLRQGHLSVDSTGRVGSRALARHRAPPTVRVRPYVLPGPGGGLHIDAAHGRGRSDRGCLLYGGGRDREQEQSEQHQSDIRWSAYYVQGPRP